MRFRRVAYLLCAGLALRADFDPKRWKRRQPVPVAGPVTRVALDGAVWAGAQPSLADLRVVRDGVAEVPYLLATAVARAETSAVPARLVNRESRGGALMATLEFDGKQLHNWLELLVTREDFRTKVRVEASDDGRAWAVVRAAAYVFRYKTDEGRVAEHLTIQYPESRRRLVRLTLEDWPEPALFTGVRVARSTANEARRTAVWTGVPALASEKQKTSCYVLNTKSLAPRDRLTLSPGPAPAVFHRSVTLEESRDGQAWQWLAAGAIYRLAGEASLTVEFGETRLPFQRVCVFQGDDAPVRLEQARLEGVDREVTFRAEAPGQYWLYYGEPQAVAPSYDLARTAQLEAAVAAQPGAAAANPAWEAPPEPVKPWSDRYPALLYGALGLAVAGLGWMALRLLRGEGPAGE